MATIRTKVIDPKTVPTIYYSAKAMEPCSTGTYRSYVNEQWEDIEGNDKPITVSHCRYKSVFFTIHNDPNNNLAEVTIYRKNISEWMALKIAELVRKEFENIS